MSRKPKVATEKEVLSLFTSVMRGEINSRVIRKDDVLELPPTIAERMHAAEQLCKRSTRNDPTPMRKEAVPEMDALVRAMEGGA